MVQIREHDTWIVNGASLGSGATTNKKLEAQGSDKISGVVSRSSNYSVDLEYLDNDGNVVQTETVLSAGSGTRDFDQSAHSDEINVKVIDEASASATVDINAKLR